MLSKRIVCGPITIAMTAPTGDGGAAAVLCSEEFVRKHHLEVRVHVVLKVIGLIINPKQLHTGYCVFMCVCVF